MSPARDPFDFTIRIPEGWCAHDPNPDPTVRRKTTEAAVDRLIHDEPALADARAALVERMLGFAREADEKGAMAAASLWTIVDDTEAAANMMVLSAAREAPDSVEAEITALVRHLATTDDADVGRRDVSAVDLPAGRAVRLRTMVRSDGDPGQPGVVVEVVQHWMPVPDAAHILIVSCTTPCLVYGDELATVFDSIAGSLELT